MLSKNINLRLIDIKLYHIGDKQYILMNNICNNDILAYRENVNRVSLTLFIKLKGS